MSTVLTLMSTKVRCKGKVQMTTRVPVIPQKFNSPIVKSIGQSNHPMQWQCDGLNYCVLFKQQRSIKNGNF